MSSGHASSKRQIGRASWRDRYHTPFPASTAPRCPRHPARNRRSRPTAYEFLGVAWLECTRGRVRSWDCSFLVAFIRDGKGAVEPPGASYMNSMDSTRPVTGCRLATPPQSDRSEERRGGTGTTRHFLPPRRLDVHDTRRGTGEAGLLHTSSLV